MQIPRFTSSKPSEFAFASDEKSIRRPTASFVRCHLKNRRAGNPARRFRLSKTHGELERAEALSIINRARRRVRREGCLPEGQASRFATGKAKSKISVCRRRGGFCGGKSHFPEQKSLPCSFCARKSERFQQKLVGVVVAGELAPPSTSLSKKPDCDLAMPLLMR